jgi:hypothetical protein
MCNVCNEKKKAIDFNKTIIQELLTNKKIIEDF